MPKCKKFFRDKEKCKAYINKNRLKYYRKTSHAKNDHNKWTDKEIVTVLKHEITDTEIALALGRSVQAVQLVRLRYKDDEKYSFIKS